MSLGSFAFVLHAHIPYVRHAEQTPYGEELLHTAMAETYIPLLNALYELKREGIEPRLAISFSPILLEQLADANVQDHFELYLEERLALAKADTARAELVPLAQWYHTWYADTLAAFRERYARDLIGAFKRLRDAGNLDLLTSTATHGYLPSFERDSTIYAQLKVGVETTRRHFGHTPRGIWLPEGGYRPAYMLAQQYKPGIEEFLAEFNLGYFFVDSNAITNRPATTPVANDAPRRKAVVRADDRPSAKLRTTLRPYAVQAANVAVLGCDQHAAMQVSSAPHSYPIDFVYREPRRKDPHSGLPYWRNTSLNAPLEQKEWYDPAAAFAKAQRHAAHFVDIVTHVIRTDHYQGNKPGIIVAAYAAETLGQWWFEGVTWLAQVLRQLAASPDVELTTPRAYLTAQPPNHIIALPESSWNPSNHPTTGWMDRAIHAAESEMEALVAELPNTVDEKHSVLNQAARELLLLESSDWQTLTTATPVYASERFRQHHARFQHLAALARQATLSDNDRRFFANVRALDNPFADLDYRIFENREG